MKTSPEKLTFNWVDYLKVLYSILFAFKNTFEIEPGLYYTGEDYDKGSPLIVTSNYHMTVFRIWQKIKNNSVRILVIDTNGINVWCSSGKGNFSANKIINAIEYYGDKYLKLDNIEIILPKLAMSGVSLQKLKDNSINPKIGPIYAKELPNYLENTPYKDCVNDKFEFNLWDRFFTLIPSIVQIAYYSIFIVLFLKIIDWIINTNIVFQVLPVVFITTIIYILFFPVIPSNKFAIKGLFVSIFEIAVIFLLNFLNLFSLSIMDMIFYSLFILGFGIFFGLYYSGNSGVSNYSLVKQETTRYLPVSIVIFLFAIGSLFVKGLVI